MPHLQARQWNEVMLRPSNRIERSQHVADKRIIRRTDQPQYRPDRIVPRLEAAEGNIGADSGVSDATATGKYAIGRVSVLNGINSIDLEVLDVGSTRGIACTPEEVAHPVVGCGPRVYRGGHVAGADGAVTAWRHAADRRNTD